MIRTSESQRDFINQPRIARLRLTPAHERSHPDHPAKKSSTLKWLHRLPKAPEDWRTPKRSALSGVAKIRASVFWTDTALRRSFPFPDATPHSAAAVYGRRFSALTERRFKRKMSHSICVVATSCMLF